MPDDFDIQRIAVQQVQVTGNRRRKQYPLSVGDTFEVAVRINGEVQNTLTWQATAQDGHSPLADVRVVVIDDAPEKS